MIVFKAIVSDQLRLIQKIKPKLTIAAPNIRVINKSIGVPVAPNTSIIKAGANKNPSPKRISAKAITNKSVFSFMGISFG